MGQQTKFAFSGFIGNTHDALIVFEACRRGILPRAQGRLSEAERKAIKSGDIYVFNEEESQIKRWTDGKRWSPSRILNNFLIYKEVKSDGNDGDSGEDGEASQSSKAKAEDGEVDELAPSSSSGVSTERRPSNTPSLPSSSNAAAAESSQSPRTVDPKLRNITGGLELLPNRKEGGLIKKTISVAGLHMIGYYTPEDVLADRLRQPGSVPELANLDISHPFLMAQFFRHPPQVTFDADQMPHFAGITDDEPMVRRPHAPQRRKREQSGQATANAVEATLLSGPTHGSFQNVTQERPLLASLPSRTSLSPLGPPNSNHMMHSPIQHAPQSFASLASQLSLDTGALLAPVRPPTGPRSSTGLSNHSASDASSPRLRSTLQHRHEPYRLPSGRNRYSVMDPTPSPHVENLQPVYPYPRQGSLPNPGMDYYRNGGQLGTPDSFQSPYSRSLEQYPWSPSGNIGNATSEYQYTLAGSEPAPNAGWTMNNSTIPQDAPQDFYSASAVMQASQLAPGVPPPQLQPPHPSISGPGYANGPESHAGYPQPTLYAGPSFYSRTPMQVDHRQQEAQPWYGRAQEPQTDVAQGQSHPGHHPHPQQIIAPQAVQHLAGFLPQTCYSPLLPSSAAYANDLQPQEYPQNAESSHGSHQVKAEPTSPGKQGTYDSNSQKYVSAPPPPSYTQPNGAYTDQAKVLPPGHAQEDCKPEFNYQYATSGMYNPPQMEDPRDG